MRKDELALIQRAPDDSDAFVEVFRLYKPIALGLMRQYNLRGMAREDWLQEAQLALWRAVRMYDASSGSQFGSYYKMILRSHFSSVVRHGLAKKRLLLNSSLALTEADVDLDAIKSGQRDARNATERSMVVRLDWQEFLDMLSPLELRVFEHLLQCEVPDSNSGRRASERVRRKLRMFLADNMQ
jgi:RNA polymerase sporulation-specific sigma factor